MTSIRFAETKHQEESIVKNTTIAIDLAKSVFEIGISHRPGHVARKHSMHRARTAVGGGNSSREIIALLRRSNTGVYVFLIDGKEYRSYGFPYEDHPEHR